MRELVFVKLGGSLITDKNRRESPRLDIIARMGTEIAAALGSRPDLRLVLGHGSGSFGHYAAHEYGVHLGNLEDWRGVAVTSSAAQRLNRLVTDMLLEQGVSVVSVQPSASARCRSGGLLEMAVAPIEDLLNLDLIPLVYGDVAMDEERGCCILSTEQIFAYLARRLNPRRMIIVGEVHGVFTADPRFHGDARPIAEISSSNIERVSDLLSASHGVDVTGGMAGKVADLFRVVRDAPELAVHLISGMMPGMVEAALRGEAQGEGTLMLR